MGDRRYTYRSIYEDESEVRAQLKRMRTTAQLSQVALAEMLGVSNSLISKVEAGKSAPTFELAARWALACGFEVSFDAGRFDRLPGEILEALAPLDRYQQSAVLDFALALGALPASASHLLVVEAITRLDLWGIQRPKRVEDYVSGRLPVTPHEVPGGLAEQLLERIMELEHKLEEYGER